MKSEYNLLGGGGGINDTNGTLGLISTVISLLLIQILFLLKQKRKQKLWCGLHKSVDRLWQNVQRYLQRKQKQNNDSFTDNLDFGRVIILGGVPPFFSFF